MKSKLTYKAYLFPLLAISLIIVSVKVLIDNYPIDLLKLRWVDYFMTILFFITLVWLIKFETLKKMIFIEVSDKNFVHQNIIFNKRDYNFNDLIAYKTQIDSTRLGDFEETIISTNDGSKIILSEFFLDNYKELKIKLTNKLTDNGGARKNVL
jgi:hypothetical protein